jgi:ferredoxin
VTRFDTCSLCPRLCRDACPVATGSAREATVPAWIGATLREWELGRLPDSAALEAATACVDCGGCRDHCHLHVPLPEYLRTVRAALVEAPPIAPLAPIEGTGEWIAVETDERPLAALLATRLSGGVRRWKTTDRLGVDAVESPAWAQQAPRLRSAVGAARVVVADGGAARALAAAGIEVTWAHVAAGEAEAHTGSCVAGGDRPLRCCGAAGPLLRHHPDDARRVALRFAERSDDLRLVDARCRNHLRSAGITASDWIDRWMEAS